MKRSSHKSKNKIIVFFFLSISITGSNARGGDSLARANAFLDKGLIHPAFRVFESILANSSESLKDRLAAADQITRVEVAHPGLELNVKAARSAATSLPIKNETVHRLLLTLLARGRLDPSDFPQAYRSNPEDLSALKLVFALNSTRNVPNSSSLPLLLSAIDAAKKLPEPRLFVPLLNLAEITGARLLYMAERYGEALERTKRILKKYPSLPDAYELEAWIKLALRKDTESAESALTLRTPAFQNYFSPQGALIPAIAYAENCDFGSAKPFLGYFRSFYRKENDYIARPTVNYFSDLVSGLKQSGPVSPKIMADWVSSPTVLALLDETNLLVDEKKEAVRRKDPKVLAYLSALEKRNAAQIQSELARRTSDLRANLNEATQNAALIEVDVLLGMTKGMEEHPTEKPGSVKKLATTKGSRPRPVWRWEKRDIASLEKDELWTDELSDLVVKIENKCK